MQVRPLSAVPKRVLLLLAIGLSAQLGWHFSHPPLPPVAANLPQPPTLATLQLASFGEPIALSKMLLLYLQNFDDQPGVNAPFWHLDYPRITTWLGLTLQLDPPGQYPLFLASEVYGDIRDQAKQRLMFEFVYHQFFINPNQRWRALAYAAIKAKHQLNDLPLAHRYAEAIRLNATAPEVPDWAKQMDIFILEDMGQYDNALSLLDALIQSGQVSNRGELELLQGRRDSIAAKVNRPKL